MLLLLPLLLVMTNMPFKEDENLGEANENNNQHLSNEAISGSTFGGLFHPPNQGEQVESIDRKPISGVDSIIKYGR